MSLTRAVRYETRTRSSTPAAEPPPRSGIGRCQRRGKTRDIVALQALQRDIQIEMHEAEVGRAWRCWSIR